MIKEALEYFRNITKAEQFTVHDLPYTDKTLTLVAPPRPSLIEVETLDAVEELVKLALDECDESDVFVHIRDFATVQLKNIRSNQYGYRHTFIQARAEPCQFLFGQFRDPESFIISLQTCFVETTELKALIQLASSLTAENVAIAEDDGVSQKATVRSGVALKTTRKIEPKIKLKPYRTFREVEQPESMFLLRLKNASEGHPPSCALFEADGGAWKIQAVKNIAKWFKGKLANVIS